MSDAEAQETCPEQVQRNDVDVPDDAEVLGSLKLEERNESAAEIEMGRRALVQREIYLTKSEGRLPPLESRVILSKGQLFRGNPQSVIHRRDYTANAVVTGSREVTVSVCLDRAMARLEPGAFSGFLKMDDPRLEFVEIPLTVKIQYANWPLVALPLGFLVWVFAPLAVWASARHAAGMPVIGRGAIQSLWDWLRSNPVGLGAGLVAATGAFLATYWVDPTWGADIRQWFSLLGTMWASATGTTAVGSLASKGGSAVR